MAAFQFSAFFKSATPPWREQAKTFGVRSRQSVIEGRVRASATDQAPSRRKRRSGMRRSEIRLAAKRTQRGSTRPLQGAKESGGLSAAIRLVTCLNREAESANKLQARSRPDRRSARRFLFDAQHSDHQNKSRLEMLQSKSPPVECVVRQRERQPNRRRRLVRPVLSGAPPNAASIVGGRGSREAPESKHRTGVRRLLGN